MGLFDLLSIGSRTLLTAQLAQATVGSNAANVATPGYSRRRVTLTEAAPITAGGLTLGMGVQAVGLERIRDRFLDAQWRLDQQDLAFAKTQAGVLDQLGALLSPADGAGLGQALDGLWAAFGDLAARPEDTAVRRTLLAEAQRVADVMHGTRDALDDMQRDAYGLIADRVTEVNSVAARLASINADTRARPGDPALADERDRLVDQLAGLVGVRATVRDDGTVQVVVDGTGIQLVDGGRAATLTVAGTPTSGSVTVSVDGTALPAPGGELGGALRMRNSTTDGLPWAIASLDALAAGVIGAVNRVHAGGAGLTLAQTATGSLTLASPTQPLATALAPFSVTSGNLSLGVFDATGTLVSSSTLAVDPSTMSLTDLATAISALPNLSASVSAGRLVVSTANPAHRLAFGPDASGVLAGLGVNGFFTGTDARTMGVDAALVASPTLVAAAQADFTNGRVSPGDARNAALLAALGANRFLASGTQTAAEFLGAFGGGVGAVGRAAQARVDTLGALTQSIDAQRQSVAGVNLDEELADMVRYQHAYEAGARYIQTVSSMIETVLAIV